jgi:hypothetical protein
MDISEPVDRIHATLAGIGITGARVALARPSLEDVFVSLTKRFAGNEKSASGS